MVLMHISSEIIHLLVGSLLHIFQLVLKFIYAFNFNQVHKFNKLIKCINLHYILYLWSSIKPSATKYILHNL